MTAAATTEPARPKLALNKKRVVNVAALKQQNPTPAPTPYQQEAAERAAKKAAEKAAKQAAHEKLLQEHRETAARKRAEKAAAHAAKMAELGRARADERTHNRLAAEEAQKRATAHRDAFSKMLNKLTMIGCKKPLALNSYEILLEYARNKISPDISATTVRHAIGGHCSMGKYLDSLARSAGKPRYHPLSGAVVGEVTEEEAQKAAKALDKLRKTRRDARKAAQAGKIEP